MSGYLLQQSGYAPVFDSVSDIEHAAKTTGEASFGWVSGRFYQVYPGGRTIDYTQTVARTAKRHGVDPELYDKSDVMA